MTSKSFLLMRHSLNRYNTSYVSHSTADIVHRRWRPMLSQASAVSIATTRQSDLERLMSMTWSINQWYGTFQLQFRFVTETSRAITTVYGTQFQHFLRFSKRVSSARRRPGVGVTNVGGTSSLPHGRPFVVFLLCSSSMLLSRQKMLSNSGRSQDGYLRRLELLLKGANASALRAKTCACIFRGTCILLPSISW